MAEATKISQDILDRLLALARDLALAVARKDERATVAKAEAIRALAEVLESIWPPEIPLPDLSKLRRHIGFAAHFAGMAQWERMPTDALDCQTDISELSSFLTPVLERREDGRATIFMAHSREDKVGREFFDRLCSAAGVRAYWYPYPEGPTRPHSIGIRRAINESASLFFVLSKSMAKKPHVRSWVSFEAGIAVGLNRPVWVFEPVGEMIEIPVPGAFGYLQRPAEILTLRTFPYEQIIKSAGMSYPRTGESDVFFHAICGNPDCGERFVAHLLDPKSARCPACRKADTIRRQSDAERAQSILETPLLKTNPNRPREMSE